VLLHELPSKIGQRVLRSVTWTELDRPGGWSALNLRAAVARLRKGIQKRGRAIMVHVPIGSEHRWGERVRVDLPVNVLEDGRAPVDGCLKNISLSGALLKSSHDRAPLINGGFVRGQGAGIAEARSGHRD
jgi:hypothetical protein